MVGEECMRNPKVDTQAQQEEGKIHAIGSMLRYLALDFRHIPCDTWQDSLQERTF